MSEKNNKTRAATVRLRLKPAEQADWQAQAEAEDLTLSDLIRKRMGSARPTGIEPKRQRRTGRKADPALLAALGRVGNNLNQVAKWANTYKTDADARQVLAALVSIERILLSYRPMPGGHDEGEVPDAG